MKVAVVGSGITGLASAWLLGRRHRVTLFEQNERLGGHAHTVTVGHGDRSIAVDTGFIVYNDRNYPNLVALFQALDVPTEGSDMSFSVSVDGGAREWSGQNPLTLFAQPTNLLRPSFHRMLRDVLRFNREGAEDLIDGRVDGLTMGDYLDRGGYSDLFRRDYLLPMAAAIWSSPMDGILAFPATSLLRFFHNHGLLTVSDQPKWRTVTGGSVAYVDRLAADLRGEIRTSCPIVSVARTSGGVVLHDAHGQSEQFDEVVLAVHGDQAFRLLADPSPQETHVLKRVSYRPNRVVLHRDSKLMPRRRRAWASWNYLSDGADGSVRRDCVTYWMNRLQNIDRRYPLFVTVNPTSEPDPARVFGEFTYRHPQFDRSAVAAQSDLAMIQGARNTWYCGAWCGYGFHEDGLRAGLSVAMALGARPDWTTDVTPAGYTDSRQPDRLMAAAGGD